MRIEIANNKVFLKLLKKKLEIHPLWLRERARLDNLHDKNTDQRLAIADQRSDLIPLPSTSAHWLRRVSYLSFWSKHFRWQAWAGGGRET